MAKALSHIWISSQRSPKELLADIQKYVTFRYDSDVRRILNIHNSFTTKYYTQAHRQFEKFNRTLKAAVPSLHDHHQTERNLCLTSLTYECKLHSAHIYSLNTFSASIFRTTYIFCTTNILGKALSTDRGNKNAMIRQVATEIKNVLESRERTLKKTSMREVRI